MWSSTCFGQHTAHHLEPKTALAASGFSYVEGCGWCQAQFHCAWHHPPSTCPTTFHVWKTRGCQCSFRLLMMGGVSPETCWASYKYGIIKFWYIVAFCWIFIYELYYDARIHEHQSVSVLCLCLSVWIHKMKLTGTLQSLLTWYQRQKHVVPGVEPWSPSS